MADTRFFLVLLSILAVCSILTAVIIQSYQSWNTYGNDSFTGKCEGTTGVYCPYNPGIFATLSGTIDLTASDMTNSSYLFCIGGQCGLHWIYNNGIGFISNNSATNINNHYLYLKGVNRGTDGYFSVNYTVNNTVKEKFIIVIHDSRDSNFGVEFTDDEVGIPSIIPYLYTARYEVQDIFLNPTLQIATRYNPTTDNLLVYLNNQLIINDDQGDITGLLHGDCTEGCYWGGIGTKENGVTLKNYYVKDSQTTNIEEDEPTFWDRILDLVPWAREIWNFISTFLSIANPFSSMTTTDTMGIAIVPWWLSIFIDLIIIGVVAYGVQILRGN